MFSEQLKKIFKIIKQTNNPVIIYDSNTSEQSYVLMTLDYYTDLILDKKTKTQKKLEVKNSFSKLSRSEPESAMGSEENIGTKNLTEEDVTDKINREISEYSNSNAEPYLAEENGARKAWKIPGKVIDKAQEVA